MINLDAIRERAVLFVNCQREYPADSMLSDIVELVTEVERLRGLLDPLRAELAAYGAAVKAMQEEHDRLHKVVMRR